MLRRTFHIFAASPAATLVVRSFNEKDILHSVSHLPHEAQRSWKLFNSVARKELQSFLSTCPTQSFLSLRKARRKAISPDGKVGNASILNDWKTRTFSDVTALAEHYENVLAPAAELLAIIEKHTLLCYGYRDVLKLKRVSAEELERTSKLLAESEKTIGSSQAKLKQYVSQCFDTHVFNSIINVFRICGESNHQAATYSQRILDDMTKLSVPFDATTQQLLRSVCFGDEFGEDSDMLFALVEYPETGEVTLRHDPVRKVNEEIVEIVAKRHNIIITPTGSHKFDDTTFPMLPREE